MSLIDEFRYALRDGLGQSEAIFYKLSIWSDVPNAALAYSSDKKTMLLLFLCQEQETEMTGDEFLDMAKAINKRLGCFVVPNQKVTPKTYWGGKSKGPILAYTFKILDEPSRWL